MEQYLIDSNIISGFFSNSYSLPAMRLIASAIDRVPIISVITQIEALSWVNKDKSKETILKSFVADAIIVQLNSEIVEICIKLRRSKKIKTPDAIIAATAIANSYTLISTDKDFYGIPNLKLINPKEL